MTRRTKLAAATVALALALTACSNAAPAEQQAQSQRVSDGGGGADLQPVRVDLGDGRSVECVALIGYSKASLSCNWNGASE